MRQRCCARDELPGCLGMGRIVWLHTARLVLHALVAHGSPDAVLRPRLLTGMQPPVLVGRQPNGFSRGICAGSFAAPGVSMSTSVAEPVGGACLRLSPSLLTVVVACLHSAPPAHACSASSQARPTLSFTTRRNPYAVPAMCAACIPQTDAPSALGSYTPPQTASAS